MPPQTFSPHPAELSVGVSTLYPVWMLRPEIELGYAPTSIFNATLRNDLKAVADSVADAVEKIFASSVPPAGIRRIWCFYDAKSGPLVVSHPTEYQICLSVLGRDYCPFALQLSHELAHVMLDPRRTNWVIEAIAVAVSMKVLDDLAQSWHTNPPYDNWASYAPNFAAYRTDTAAGLISTLDPRIVIAVKEKDWPVVTEYLRGQRSALDADPINRPMNMLCALRLLAEPIVWPRLRGLAAKTTPPPVGPGDFNGNIPLDTAKLDPHIKLLLQCLGV